MDVNLENDIISNIYIVDKAKHSEVYCQNLYAALCNNRFFYENKEWTCSWRHSGGIISSLLGSGDYTDWYCSGIGSDVIAGYVPEGYATEEIKLDLLKMGWTIRPYEGD